MQPFRSDEIDLREYWAILVRRRWVIYLSVVAVTVGALIASFLMTPLYRATVTLQIERQTPDVFAFDDMSRIDHSWAAYSDFYQTQYALIGSMSVARLAADRLALPGHPEFSPGDSKPGLLSRLLSWIPRSGGAPSQPPDPAEIAALGVAAGLEVTPVRDSHLVDVSWVSRQPELAAQVANAVADAYIHFNIDAQYSTTDQVQEFLIDQIAELKQDIARYEDDLQVYGEAKRIVSIDDTSNITLRALQDVSQRRTAAQTTLAKAEAEYNARLEAEPGALPEVLDSDLIWRLRQEYATYEADYTERSTRFGEDWPGMQVLQSKLDQARRRLDLETDLIATQVRANARANYEQALREVRNLDRLLQEQETAAQTLKRDAVEFANLRSEVTKKREALDALIARQNEMVLSSRLKDLDTTSTNIRVMERARIPSGPFKPNTKYNLALGLLVGLGLGVGLAFVLDHLDNTINDAGDMQNVVPLPLLAMIPYEEEPAASRVTGITPVQGEGAFDLIAHRDNRSVTSEAYRELRTSILLSSPGHPPQRIMISSALPGEGKTATAINLSIVLSQLDRRVLLVDTDLRRPRLHKAFNVSDPRGASTFLSGLAEDVGQLTLATGIENLDLLPSGPIPPNPSELLNSPRFAEMCERLLELGYDHLVFDSPPALSVSDPIIVASTMNTGILVVRAGKTSRQSVRLAAAKLQQAGVASFGAVLNSVDASTRGSTYYRYQYYGRESAIDAEGQSPRSRADSA